MKEHGTLFQADMVRALLREVDPKTQTRRLPNCRNCYVDGRFWKPADFAMLDFSAPGIFVDQGPSPAGNPGPYLNMVPKIGPPGDGEVTFHRVYPKWQKGDVIWVRETCRAEELFSGLDGVRYRADFDFRPIDDTPRASIDWLTLNTYGKLKPGSSAQGSSLGPWVPSIHMPRWASRITLEITSVRIERLQDISEADAIAEGVVPAHMGFPGDHGPACHSTRDARLAYLLLWEQINGPGSWAANPWIWAIEFKRVKP